MSEPVSTNSSEHANSPQQNSFVGHARTFALLTLVSRIAGLVRDALFARFFGSSAFISSWVTAFIIPNVFRRLFGEGALSAAFIPEYTQLVKRDPEKAHRLASLVMVMLLAILTGLVILIELALVLLYYFSPLRETGGPVLIYSIVMLPYMPLVCMTAILGGMLQTHGKFVPTAASPILLNGALILAATIWSAILGADPFTSVLAISFGVLIAGVLQFAWCVWELRHHARWTKVFDGVGDASKRMLIKMGPIVIGMGTLQLGTMVDSLLAGWPNIFGAESGIGSANAYPMDTGAASILWYAQRLYQFPLGVFGIAIATAVFPALARTADEPAQFRETLRRGIRLSLFIGLPASVGLIFVRQELTNVIYSGGEFGADQAARVGNVLLGYAPAVWAYSLTHVLTRAYYARGDTRTPMHVGLITVALNIVLSVTLMWPLRESGLAWATTIAAGMQCVVLALLARRRLGPDPDAGRENRAFGRAIARSVLLTGVMGAVLWGAELLLATITGGSYRGSLIRLISLAAIGGSAFFALAILTRATEVRWLVERGPKRH